MLEASTCEGAIVFSGAILALRRELNKQVLYPLMTYGKYYKIIPETPLTPEQLEQMRLHRYAFKAKVLFSRSLLKAQVYLYQN